MLLEKRLMAKSWADMGEDGGDSLWVGYALGPGQVGKLR